MRTALCTLFAAAVLTVSATAVFASASNTPTNYQPDPALKTESVGQLQARIRKPVVSRRPRSRVSARLR